MCVCVFVYELIIYVDSCGVFVILVLSILMANMFLYGIVQFNIPFL